MEDKELNQMVSLKKLAPYRVNFGASAEGAHFGKSSQSFSTSAHLVASQVVVVVVKDRQRGRRRRISPADVPSQQLPRQRQHLRQPVRPRSMRKKRRDTVAIRRRHTSATSKATTRLIGKKIAKYGARDRETKVILLVIYTAPAPPDGGGGPFGCGEGDGGLAPLDAFA